MGTELKIALLAATLALPFWGAFGFLMVGFGALASVSIIRLAVSLWRG